MQNDLFFATEIEAEFKKPKKEEMMEKCTKTNTNESLIKSIVYKELNNVKVHNQLDIVNKAEKYVDIDQQIYENYIERKQV
jgi:hypothetical protein